MICVKALFESPYTIGLAMRGLAYGVVSPLMVYCFRRSGLTLLEIGVLASIFELTLLVAEVPTGMLADKYGHSYLMAALTIVVLQITKRVASPLIGGHLNELVSNGERATAMSVLSLSGSVGEVAAGAVVGYVAELYGLRFAIRAGSALLVVVLATVMMLHRVRRKARLAAEN